MQVTTFMNLLIVYMITWTICLQCCIVLGLGQHKRSIRSHMECGNGQWSRDSKVIAVPIATEFDCSRLRVPRRHFDANHGVQLEPNWEIPVSSDQLWMAR